MALSRIPRAGCVSTTAFFLCDIQARFVPLISRMPTVIAAAATLVRTAEATGRPLIITEQYPKVFGNTVPELTGLCPAVKAIPKMQFSMMTPEVHAALPRDSYDSAVLFGIETHVCVQQTCFDLLRDGKQVFVVADACSSQRLGDREFALRHMASAGAFVTTTESLLLTLVGGADHPTFKAVSAVLKEHNAATSARGEAGRLDVLAFS